MKFRLSTEQDFFTQQEIDKLTNLGFTFHKEVAHTRKGTPVYLKQEEGKLVIDISSLKELLAFQEEYGNFLFLKNEIQLV